MALAIQKSRTPSVKGRLLSTLIMAFALMLQPMYGVVAGQVARAVSPATLRVSTEAELRDKLATANPGDFIVLEADISISEPLVLSRPGVSIYGQGHTVSYSTSANTNGWNAKYVLHVYRTTGVHIRDIKLTGGDAGLLVNGSEVSLFSQTGKSVDVSDNEFGGIEVSQGGGVTETPELMLYDGLNLVNTTETAAKPTVWTDKYVGTDWIKDLRSSSALSTLINPTRDTQRYYYLNPAMLPAPEIHSVRFSTWSSDYNGIVVDQYLKGFTDATSYRAIIHRANGSDVIRDGAVNTINHINSGGDVALTTPFNFAGSAAGSWFGAQNSSWTTATRPLGVTIEVVSATHGLVTFSTPVEQSLVEKNGEYKDLIPAPVRPVITSVTPSQGSFISGNAQRIDVNVADIDDVRTGNLQLNKVVTEGQSPANGAREVYTLQKDATGWYAMVDTTKLSGDGKYLFKVEAHGFDGVPHGYYGNNSAWQYPSYYFVVDNTAPKINSGSVEFNKMVNIGGVGHTSAKLGDGFLEVTFTTDEPLKLVGSQVGLSVPGLSGVPSTGWTKVELVDASENKYMARISLVDRTDTNIPGYEGFFNDKTFKDVKLYFRTVDALNNTDAVYYYADGSFGKSPSKAYRFTIDNTAPTLEVSSPVGDSTYLTTEDINVETDVGDDIEIDRIVIFVNGRYFGDYDSRQVVKDFATAKGGSSFFTIPAGVLPVGEHRLIVNAYDKAGNLTTVRVPFSVVESEEGQEPVDRPGQPEDGTPTPESLNTGEGEDEDEEIETNSQAFPGPVLAFGNQGVLGNQGTETDPVDDSEVEGVVAGDQDDNGTRLTDTAAFGSDSKLLGMAWYWWLAILAALVGGWLLVAAAIRRGREEEA